MGKYLFYVMRGEKLCFMHVLLNALDLSASGNEVKIIFEGQSVTLPPVLAGEGNALYKKALEDGLIAGVCLACAKKLGAYDEVSALGLNFLSDMSGHAGMRSYTEQGYSVITF